MKASAVKPAWGVGTLVSLEFLLCLFFWEKSFAHWLLYICPFVRYCDFLVGVEMYVLTQTCLRSKQRYHGGMLPAFLSFCAALIASIFYGNMWFIAFIWIIPSALLIGSAYAGTETRAWNRGLFENKLLVGIGDISYGIFLTHQLLIRYITKIASLAGVPVIMAYPLALVLTIAAACAIKKRGNLRT